MISIHNIGYTSKELYSFKSIDELPSNFSGICQINQDIMHYLNGKLHREDGPAVEEANGNKKWYQHHQLHRIDGTACEYNDNTELWYKDDKLHREDGGPDVTYPNGYQSWYVNNSLHRTDGPAVEFTNAAKHWYLNNIKYGTNNEFTNQSWYHFQKTLLF